ncbi:MAG: hypothetical protein HY459_04775 [Parcubacteria group bacterium]|nr:hypothetical protein [Parcubacteria group bacterium]
MDTILGIPVNVFLLWLAALAYAIGVIFFLDSYRKERGELMIAFLAFVTSMAFANFFMGAGEYWQIPLFMQLGTLAIFVGSAFMLKFPLTALPPSLRRPLFWVSLILFLLFAAWLIVAPLGQRLAPQLSMWFMVVINGILVGGYLVWAGLKATERWKRMKAVGGGIGVATCCVASHGAAVFGAVFLSAFLQVIAPFVMIGAILGGRYLQRRSQTPRS